MSLMTKMIILLIIISSVTFAASYFIPDDYLVEDLIEDIGFNK